MRKWYVFTSESVSGHPDKVCDQISDAILDAYLKKIHAHVAVKRYAEDRLILSGEISSPVNFNLDIDSIVRKVIKDIGYVHSGIGFDYNCEINNYLHLGKPH